MRAMICHLCNMPCLDFGHDCIDSLIKETKVVYDVLTEVCDKRDKYKLALEEIIKIGPSSPGDKKCEVAKKALGGD